MSYQTTIPDDFKPPQFLDDTFKRALAAYQGGGNSAKGPWICALGRPELDPSSRTNFNFAAGINYDIKAKTDKVAMMHVISVGRGRVRLGHREVIPVSVGDMVLINLREAGHWIWIEGICFYFFTGDVAMAKVYRTTKTLTPPPWIDGDDTAQLTRRAWQEELYWNIAEPLNDYVILGRDTNAERVMRNGEGTRVELTDQSMSDGTRSDDSRDNRFPIVYRRVFGAGPGRKFRREDELGFPEFVHSVPEVEPGDMLAMSKNVRAASCQFQGMPLEFIHAASVINGKVPPAQREATGAETLSFHETCTTTIPWDVEREEGASDEEEQLKGKS